MKQIVLSVVSTTAAIFFPVVTPANAQLNEYPVEVKQSFMNECVAKSGKQRVCACVLDRAQNQYNLEEFVQLTDQARSSGKVPTEVTKIVGWCIFTS